jgi:hypothetical protein
MKIAEDHWKYIESILFTHNVRRGVINDCRTAYIKGFVDGVENREKETYTSANERFHYETAYTHGKKHSEEGRVY